MKDNLMKHDPLFDKELQEDIKKHYEGTKNHHRILEFETETIDNRIPSYYIGNNGYEARKVVDGFELNYNIGTAVTYLLRAEKKHETPDECIEKAIAHLEFELEKLKK
tara:strand:+ start:312 stop:635 length:324 start_codon:yes stop_codon:yes gene_type:complete